MKREEFVLYNTFPADAVTEGWNNGIDISHVAYGSSSWAVLMAEKTGFTGQRYFQRSEFPAKAIDEGWKENYYISNITWGDSNWVLIMSQGCGYTDQQWKCGSKFPSKDVEKTIKAGFHISYVTYGEGRWVIVLSKSERTCEQKWEMFKDFPEKAIEEYWNQGYIITSLAYGEQKWLLVVSKGTDILYQSWAFRSSFPEQEISEKRNEGYWVSSLTYGNGLWVVVMSMTEEEYQKQTSDKPQETRKKPRTQRKKEENRNQSSDTSAPDEVQFELAMGELKKLTGLVKVKEDVDSLMKYIRIEQKRQKEGLSANPISLHAVFTGPPGTGKTTVARLLGRIYHSLGLLKKGHVIEVDRSGLVAEYVGQTAIKTNKAIDSALDGILFIDEAYALASDLKSGYGQEAIDTLVKRMEDERGRLIVIVAGYPKEMNDFITSNTGLQSRFNQYFTFADYKADELLEIFKQTTAERGFTLSPDAEAKCGRYFGFLYSSRTKTFGNARAIRNFFEELIRVQAIRLSALENPANEELQMIMEADIEEAVKDVFTDDKEETLEQIMGELSGMIGLANIKEEIVKLANYIKVEKLRKTRGLQTTPLVLHSLFLGAPGTGKTTVARILGRVYKSMGILAKGHVVEVSRADLVAQYVGQTAPKTDKVIDSAINGILFVDEAYMLTRGGENDFGQEAIDTLLKRMEDERDKLIVVLAGYTGLMKKVVDSNPGLESRFTRSFTFSNYSVNELFEIYQYNCRKKGFIIADEVLVPLRDYFEHCEERTSSSFGNARYVRNLFERTLQELSARLASVENPETPELTTITKEDFLHAISTQK
ncbi:MAG: AAA family ATPase [Bacteroidota bacterium]|jgi:SpoVK/Ycf46/Vps4 family AAA+-type ATPase